MLADRDPKGFWPIIILRSDLWTKCPFCGSTVVFAPPRDADVYQQAIHFQNVHDYKITKVEDDMPETGIRTLTMEHRDS